MSHELFVARQPIFDAKGVAIGYELLFRSGPDNVFRADDADVATMQNLDTALGGFGLDNLVGSRMAFVNVTERVMHEALYTLLPPEQTVLELPPSVAAESVIESCRRARGEGYRIALDHSAGKAALEPLLEVADVVKVDLGTDQPAWGTARLESFKQRGVWRIATRIENHDDRARAERFGFTHFQGHYFRKPEVLKTRDLPTSKFNLMRFLKEVNQEEVSYDRLEELLRAEASLSIRLLRYLNSAGFGWRYEVPSVRQAIRLLGADALRKWASLMAVRGLSEDRPNELLVTALVRANFAERVGTIAGFERADLELFLLGLLSLMDAVLGRPLPDVLSDMALPDESQAALLQRSGRYGSVLSVVEAVEQADWDRLSEVAQPIGLRTETLPAHYAAALKWADQTAGSEAFAA
jgi:c-di-GMP-related signal transduction protein